MRPAAASAGARAAPRGSAATSAAASTSASAAGRPAAAVAAALPLPPVAPPPTPPVRVFARLAAAVEMDAVVSRFETLASRTAMAGLAAAAVAEAIAGDGVFAPLASDPSALTAVASAGVAALAAAAAAAAAARSRPGAGLLEPVLTSLTAPARALAAVALPPSSTPEAASALDAAVDALLAACVFPADFSAPPGAATVPPPPPPGAIDAPGAALVAALGAVTFTEEEEGDEDFSDLDVW